ncbi:hypothetical protein FB45DRAFT_298757 [Roridomyces roridus]|uniref:Uncharacterized protein n=1 Tax=Roridomyces roridus TaxID=1738132 RepID=A0AAD7FXM9_9AGAR|nr:hypothetical protein FB45DRAFT_298757 [Roridomyces roridus]
MTDANRTSTRATNMATSSSSTTTSSSSSSHSSSSTTSASGGFLSQAKLTLRRDTLLDITWSNAAHDVTINLNQYVAFTGNKLVWSVRDAGGFRSACKGIVLDGTFLVAYAREDADGSQESRLDLGGYIIFNPLTKVFEPAGLGFSQDGAEKIVASSRSLLDVTLISSFNIAKLLRDPAFAHAIKDVAERAETNAQNQREEAMREMSEEVEGIKNEANQLRDRLDKLASRADTAMSEMKSHIEEISRESSSRFEQEMTTLINSVAAMTLKAVYAQIRELDLKILNVDQQTAYETHWAPPPYQPTGTAGGDE